MRLKVLVPFLLLAATFAIGQDQPHTRVVNEGDMKLLENLYPFSQLSARRFHTWNFAHQFSGATAQDKLDNAITDCSIYARCVIFVDPALRAPATPTYANWGEYRTIISTGMFRNMSGYEQPTTFGLHVAMKKTTATDGYPYDYGAFGVYFHVTGGGSNALNNKTGYKTVQFTHYSQGSGEEYPFSIWAYKYGLGDFLTGNVLNYYYGNSTSAGDESQKGWKIATYNNLGVPLTATANTINNRTHVLTYTSASEPKEINRGDDRWVIDRTQSHTIGIVTNIGTGTNPTVTGSGTSWAGLSGQYCFSLAIDDNSGNNNSKYLVPVLRISDNTHLVLNLTAQGQANTYVGTTGSMSASYRLYPCGQIANSGAQTLGQVTFKPGHSTLFANGDAIEFAFGWYQQNQGLHIVHYPYAPGYGHNAIIVDNTWYGSNIMLVNSGQYQNGFVFSNKWCNAYQGLGATCGRAVNGAVLDFKNDPPLNTIYYETPSAGYYNIVQFTDTTHRGAYLRFYSSGADASGPNLMYTTGDASIYWQARWGDPLPNFRVHGATVRAEGNIQTGSSSNQDLAGQVTLSGGSGTYTFTTSWATAPICVATDTTATNAVKVITSTTTLTITGTGSDVISYICMGRT